MQPTIENPIGYFIAVGEADRARIKALNAIYTPTSLDLIMSNSPLENRWILDVGCGDGSLTCKIANQFKDSIIVGFDNSPAQIKVAKKTAEEMDVQNVIWEICDVDDLTQLKMKFTKLFDTVHCRLVLSHKPKPEHAIDQMLSLLVPGGRLIIEEIGAKKNLQGKPLCIEAWEKMVKLQYKLQQSHEDTIERLVTHLSKSDQISEHCTKLFNITIEGQNKKCLYRLGAEQGLRKLKELNMSAQIKTFGYDDDGTSWLKELKEFELDDSQTLVMQDYECIVATKK